MPKKQPAAILFRCKNRFGNSKTGLKPCAQYGSKGFAGNGILIEEHLLPPAGMAPKCPNPECGEPLQLADQGSGRGSKTKPGGQNRGKVLAFALLGLCGIGLLAWWLIPSGGPPKAVVNPLNAEWGDVVMGSSKTVEITIGNQGAGELVILSGELSGLGFGLQQAIERVPAGDSRVAILTFVPAQAGPASGNLKLSTNDPEHQTILITLSGTGTETGPPPLPPKDLENVVRTVFEPIDGRIKNNLQQ